MNALKPQYDHREFAERGEELFALHVAPNLRAGDYGKFVAIDIDSEDFEIDQDDFTATERLLSRRPKAQIWLMRAGEDAAYRLGAHGRRGRTV